MAVQDYKINYKSDFVLTINGDAGWAVPFCIKFWTGMPSQAYFVGFDGVKYVNCRVGDTPTQLLVMFDDHHLPIGKLKMQIAYHTTIEEFPGSVFDEVTNARDVIVTIDGTDYQVMLDFTGEDAPELEFNLPAYANEAERIQNELQRQQNEADRIAAELQREQATAAAVQGAENVNAQLNGTTLTVTNRQGVSTSVNTKGEQGEQGPVGPEGPQGQTGVSITGFVETGETETDTLYNITFSNGTTQQVAIPKGERGDRGPVGPEGPQGQTGVSITGLVKTGETETDTLYNVTFSDGTTQAVAIPKGEKGDRGPAGPTGPQGPMGDVAVITPEQQAAFTMYSVPGQNTNGPMTQKAVTDALVKANIFGTISRDADFGIVDDDGNLLAEFANGHFKTKNFDSASVPSYGTRASELDFAITDEVGQDIVQFLNGHIKTKYFYSADIAGLFNIRGKKISIIGDSISTFTGYIPSGYTSFYTSSHPSVNTVEKTWWYQVINKLGLVLGINASWSGCKLTLGENANSTTNAYVACSPKRVEDIGANGTPDIIICFVGTNDFGYNAVIGDYDARSAIPELSSTVSTTTPQNEFADAYAVMIDRIRTAYPTAKVFCCTILDRGTTFPPTNTAPATMSDYNRKIIELCNNMGVKVIRTHECGISVWNTGTYLQDGLHPKSNGMELISNCVVKELIKNF